MNELNKKYISGLSQKNRREDNRDFNEFRKDIKVEYGVSAKSAEGSAMVTIGETQVVAGVKLEIGAPFPDIPDEGTIAVNVELLPLSSPEYESGPPSVEAIELARAVIDRGIRESKAIDTKELCIEKGKKVWIILIDVYSINDAGNLADAMGLAALAALKDTKFPGLNENNEVVDYTKKTEKSLPLEKEPIPITVIKIGDKFLVDPSLNEEKAMDARLTITSLKDGELCALQKGGNKSLKIEDIDKMVDLAIEKAKELRRLL